jgi:hypothetical protein
MVFDSHSAILSSVIGNKNITGELRSGKSCGADLSGLLPNLTGHIEKEESQFKFE